MVAFISQQPRRTLDSLPIVPIDPSLIKTDASTYQFRRGGDANGVGSAWKEKNQSWDPAKHAAPLLLHERMDGSLFVADGHHRLDLAKRTNAQGKGPGLIQAQILREADGYTAADVRVIAAYKNMAHGHADTLEAARVFKEAASGKIHTELLPNLRMDGKLTISYKMSKLSDYALTEVERGRVPDTVAADISDYFSNRIMQDIAIGMAGQTLNSPGFAARVMQERARHSGLSLH